jgi:hypothetical protein
MANTNAPFGFSQYIGTGATPTFEQTVSSISSSNATAIYFGDPIVQATGTTGLGTGYIAAASAPQSLAVSGIVVTSGVAVATFTSTTAPAVGSTIVFTGTSFATGGGFNGPFQITASTTTTATFNVTGAFSSTLTFGAATVFTPVAGIFIGCKYLSTSQKRPVFSNYWPGSDANGDVTAYIVSDPNAQFLVQTGASSGTAVAVSLTSIGQNIGFSMGTGSTANGLSGAYADTQTLVANVGGTYASNSFLPFRIISLANYTPGGTSPLASINGNDSTTAYNRIVVGFNNSMPRGFAGI